MLRLLKFTLDLFDVPPVYEPNLKPPKSSEQQPKRSKKVVAPVQPPDSCSTTHPTSHTNSSLRSPETTDVYSRHAQASQQTRLIGLLIDYELQRSRRRTMTFSVSPAGLSVHAPFGMPQHSIEAAVQEKDQWIVRKLKGMQQRADSMAALKMHWQQGAKLAFLGGTLRVKVDAQARQTTLSETDEVVLESTKTWVLSLALPQNASDKKIRDTTKKWIQQQATQHYTARMQHYAALLGVTWRSLSLTNANTRWGSAKADGSIRLHWRLMQFSPEVIDYVVAHELSHLRELNHSPRFWATVASVLPDYETRQKQLKAQILPPWE